LPLLLSQFDVLPLAQGVCADASMNGNGECSATGASVVGYWCENSLRRALENLVINGIKYGDGNGVQVKVDESHGRVLISVHNSGNRSRLSTMERFLNTCGATAAPRIKRLGHGAAVCEVRGRKPWRQRRR
jgi:light-regulated signal transduction histidine kinase (bacteriophytochrome)